MNNGFDVTHQMDEAVLRLKIDGRLDGLSAPVFEKKLDEFLGEGRRQIMMDCGSLMFVSSAGLRVFLSFTKKVKKGGGQMALYGVQPIIQAIFESAGFTAFLNICPTREEALKAVGG